MNDNKTNINWLITIQSRPIEKRVKNMSKTYYHVVTERPMELGQEIIFDENHFSGVYERVYNLFNVVEDIYSNPDKYKNAELDHHLKVALR